MVVKKSDYDTASKSHQKHLSLEHSTRILRAAGKLIKI